MSCDQGWPLNRGWSEDQLAQMRVSAVEAERQREGRADADVKYTCDACCDRLRCDLVFDSYNTNGDCLAEK